MRIAAALVAACLAQPALAQWGLHGFTDDGLIYEIDEFTGDMVLVGDIGAAVIGASGGPYAWPNLEVVVLTADDQVISVNLRDLSSRPLITLTGRPAGYTPVAFEYREWPSPLYEIVMDSPTGEDIMVHADPATGVYERVGPIGLSDVVELLRGGDLLTESGGVYYNPTGEAWVLRYMVDVGEPLRAMSGSHCAGIYSGEGAYRRRNSSTPVTQIAVTGFGDIATLTYSSAWHYACDLDTTTGIAVCDLFDFLMFQQMWVGGEAVACECDTSTGPGVCDIFDFLCFQNAFVEASRLQEMCR